MASDKILVIVYYWPPSGGAGVQRWVKLTKYLSDLGFEVYVVTVDEKYASYLQLDETLLKEVDPRVRILKTRSFEAINLFARLFGKKKVPTAGFYNLDKKSFVQNLGMLIRTNLFIPDPRRGWNRYAYRQAKELIRKEGIRTVITSTPPHSSQLIGLMLKRKLKIRWISDLRDPWTDIYYYKILKHSFISRRIDKHYECQVLKHADAIITVSKRLKNIFLSKSEGIRPEKIHVVPNGYDPGDFNFIPEAKSSSGIFTVCYTGSMSDQYEPQVFLDAFRVLRESHRGLVKLQLVGSISERLRLYIKDLGLENATEFIPTVPHHQAVRFMANADALLLVIPNVENSELILTGKLFEYLAAGRPIIMVGPANGDAAEIIQDCKAGHCFDRDSVRAIADHLESLFDRHRRHTPFNPDRAAIREYSREFQAEKVASICKKLKPV